MRPESKERPDTIIGSALRASFTFCQATAGDMRGEEGERGRKQRGRREEAQRGKKGGGGGKKKHVGFRFANVSQSQKSARLAGLTLLLCSSQIGWIQMANDCHKVSQIGSHTHIKSNLKTFN